MGRGNVAAARPHQHPVAAGDSCEAAGDDRSKAVPQPRLSQRRAGRRRREKRALSFRGPST